MHISLFGSAEFGEDEESISCSGSPMYTQNKFITVKCCWHWAEGPPNPIGGAISNYQTSTEHSVAATLTNQLGLTKLQVTHFV